MCNAVKILYITMILLMIKHYEITNVHNNFYFLYMYPICEQ